MLELLGHVVHLAHDAQDLLAAGPEQALDCAARLQVEVAEVEQALRLFLGRWRRGSSPARSSADRLVGLVQLVHDLWSSAVGSTGRRERTSFDADHLEHQHRVVRGDRAPALADDVGCGDRPSRRTPRRRSRRRRARTRGWVVHGRVEVGLRAVVVDGQAAADVEVLEPGAHLDQLDVDVRRLLHRVS